MIDYKVNIFRIKNEHEDYWVAEYPALKGVAGVGETQIAALSNLIEAAKINIEALMDEGFPIPPSDSVKKLDYSGKLSARLSPSLHRKLAEVSQQEEISINQCIVEAVATYVADRSFNQAIKEYLKQIKIDASR